MNYVCDLHFPIRFKFALEIRTKKCQIKKLSEAKKWIQNKENPLSVAEIFYRRKKTWHSNDFSTWQIFGWKSNTLTHTVQQIVRELLTKTALFLLEYRVVVAIAAVVVANIYSCFLLPFYSSFFYFHSVWHLYIFLYLDSVRHSYGR